MCQGRWLLRVCAVLARIVRRGPRGGVSQADRQSRTTGQHRVLGNQVVSPMVEQPITDDAHDAAALADQHQIAVAVDRHQPVSGDHALANP